MESPSTPSPSARKAPGPAAPENTRQYRKYSAEDKARFFEARERLGNAASAARELGLNRSTCRMWAKDDSRVPGTKYTAGQKSEFFVVLDRLGSVSAAARQLGINTQTGFRWAYSMGAVQRKPHRHLTAKQRELAPKKAEFLAAVERVGNISLAAREAGIKYTQGRSWARAAGVENVAQDHCEKQTQYTPLREEDTTQKAASAAVDVNRDTGYDGDQTARRTTSAADANEDGNIAYDYQVTTAFVEPDIMIGPFAQTRSTPSPAPALSLVPAPGQEPAQAPETPVEAESSQTSSVAALQPLAPAPVGIEDLEQVIDARYLCHQERELIADLLRAGHGIRAIGRELGRSPSSVSREINRNSHPRLGYQPHGAQRIAAQARARSKPSKLATHGQLRGYVSAKLKLCWSPEQVSHALIKDFPNEPSMRVSPETIYQALYFQARGGLKREVQAALRTGRTRRKKHRNPEERRSRFRDPMINISERPAEVEDRAIPGHWEGDLVRHEALFYRAEVEDLRLCAVAAA